MFAHESTQPGQYLQCPLSSAAIVFLAYIWSQLLSVAFPFPWYLFETCPNRFQLLCYTSFQSEIMEVARPLRFAEPAIWSDQLPIWFSIWAAKLSNTMPQADLQRVSRRLLQFLYVRLEIPLDQKWLSNQEADLHLCGTLCPLNQPYPGLKDASLRYWEGSLLMQLHVSNIRSHGG